MVCLLFFKQVRKLERFQRNKRKKGQREVFQSTLQRRPHDTRTRRDWSTAGRRKRRRNRNREVVTSYKKKKQKRGRQSFEGENSPNHVVSPLVLGPKRSRSHWYINMCRLRSTSTAVLILTPTNTLPVPDYFLSPRTTEYLLPRRSTSYIFITSHVKTINSSLPLAPPLPPPSLPLVPPPLSLPSSLTRPYPQNKVEHLL